MDRTRRDGSSTSRPKRSSSSRPSPRGSRTSASPGSGAAPPPGAGLGASATRELARQHGIRPSKALGQHFLVDPNVARRIAALAEVGPGDSVVDIGAGFGSLTMALADTGARVLAVEFDRRLVEALQDVVADRGNVVVVAADAQSMPWRSVLRGAEWSVVANLPYNIATPLLLDMLDHVPTVRRYVVMVQREVGERLAARPRDEGYGAVSVKVAYRAEASLLRRVPPGVFWPRPNVESVLVRLARREPSVDVDPRRLFAVVDAGFAERRKTMRNALRRLGLDVRGATAALAACGFDDRTRAEEIDLEGFARLAAAPDIGAAVEALAERSARG